MFLQIWFLLLSFVPQPPSVSLPLCICLHLLPVLLWLFRLPARLTHTHARAHTSQTLSLVVEFIVWSVFSFSPSVLPFVFCMFCCIVHRGWDADRMQTVCSGWGVCAGTLGFSSTQHAFACDKYLKLSVFYRHKPEIQVDTHQEEEVYIFHYRKFSPALAWQYVILTYIVCMDDIFLEHQSLCLISIDP